MRCSQLVRSSISVLRSRVLVRQSRTCAGGIHASGKRPSASNVRNQRASARAVLAWRFLPRSALVSAGSPRCVTTPAASSTSYTNNQPVQRLHRHLYVLAGEQRHPRADRLAIAADPATHDLAGLGIERIEGDL